MPKKRQIPFLFAQALADTTIVWHWKPSPRLRKAGFVNVKLGTDKKQAIESALELNAGVDAWQRHDAPAGQAQPVPRQLPRVVRFGELVRSYRASDAFTGLRDKTRAEYSTRLRQLEHWAMDGNLPVRDIDKPMVRDLRNALMTGSVFVAAGTLRVLRLLLQWAEDNSIVTKNVATSINIPETPARKTRIDTSARTAILEAAVALDPDDIDGVALAIELGYWMVQRQADVLLLNRMAWRVVDGLDIDSRHIATLADPRGRVRAFRLAQQKTGTWIDAPIPPMLHDRIEERMKRSTAGWLFAHPDDQSQPCHPKTFQRRFAAAREAAATVAIMDGNMQLAEAIDACQFRDLRRTGMIAYKDAGARTQWITALSGHYALGKKTIIDVYMPGDTAGAVACVATGLTAWRARQAREATA